MCYTDTAAPNRQGKRAEFLDDQGEAPGITVVVQDEEVSEPAASVDASPATSARDGVEGG